MQRGRLLILVGLLLILATGALFLVLSRFAPPAATPTPSGPPTQQIDITYIVFAAQPIPRGTKLTADMVTVAPWATSSLPETAIKIPKDIVEGNKQEEKDKIIAEKVVDKIARYDIEPLEPLLSSLLVDTIRAASATGSDAALSIPEGKVAITIPMTRLSGIGYALEPGDHVNVLAALMFVDLDEATQTITPSQASVFTNVTIDPITGSVTYDLKPVGAEGVVEFSEGQISIPFLLQPSEPQRPRLVVQQVVQDAIVLKMGNFIEVAPPTAAASAQPAPTEAATPLPTPIPPPDIVTLIVEPQQALVLNYFVFANAKLTLALRAANDASQVNTESVTLQFAIEQFRIAVPTPQTFGLEPAVRRLKPPLLPNEPAPTIIPLPDGTYICIGANCP